MALSTTSCWSLRVARSPAFVENIELISFTFYIIFSQIHQFRLFLNKFRFQNPRTRPHCSIFQLDFLTSQIKVWYERSWTRPWFGMWFNFQLKDLLSINFHARVPIFSWLRPLKIHIWFKIICWAGTFFGSELLLTIRLCFLIFKLLM